MRQEIGLVPGELAELGHRGGMFVLGQLPPAGVMPRGAVDPRDEYPVGLRVLIDHEFCFYAQVGY